MAERIVGIIPARLNSTRLPRKLLLDETGKPLIVHTIDQVKKAIDPDNIVVVTDSPEIQKCCSSHCYVFMTNNKHENGTSRCNEYVDILLADCKPDRVVNIQADQPEIPPEVIGHVIALHMKDPNSVATAACPATEVEFSNPNDVKVVLDRQNRAMYFSRSPIPYQQVDRSSIKWKHLGIYAFSPPLLYQCAFSQKSGLEMTECLEQLRWLDNGIKINVAPVDHTPGGIDTREDYEAFCRRL